MKTHPDAPADTRTMAIVHSALRRDLERTRLVLTAAQPITEKRRTALADHLVWMMSFLNRHHSGEDAGLYPVVLQKNPAALDLLAAMDAEHQQIHPAMDALAHAASDFGRGTTGAADLLVAVENLEKVLYPHLRREEEEMMPVVAASITAADWEHWDQEHNIKGIGLTELAATGLWILDGQDAASDALMSELVPAPVRFVIKKGFGPRYRRMAATLWGGTPAAAVPALSAASVRSVA